MSADIQGLRETFAGRLLTDAADMAPFLTDWRGQWRGAARAVVQPDSVEDVAAVVRWCAVAGAALVPQGGNTGLSGGATPDASGAAVVLSLARLNRIREIDRDNATITVEAGCILQRVQEAAREAGRLFPLSLAAEGSCTIGGNLATNAGGVAVLRYGNARELCLGLEVVTADGAVWNGLRGLRKDNTGYALRDLFIGSEGTLGIITAAVLKLFPLPHRRIVALAAVDTPETALRLFERLQAALGGAPKAFELISEAALDLAVRQFPDLRPPALASTPWRLLIEVEDFDDGEGRQAQIEAVLGEALEADEVADATLAASEAQAQALWDLRERLSEAQGREGPHIKHDISVPLSRTADFIREACATLKTLFPDLRPIVFGHLGDGNLHFNVSAAPEASKERMSVVQPVVNVLVHDLVHSFNGSISAEHGLGVLRSAEAARYKSATEMKLMKAIKSALDPRGLMNPGKVLA